MEDRELLELAAKAAGVTYEARYCEPAGVAMRGLLLARGTPASPSQWWNPLQDDGDALRLAVNLRIQVPVIGGGMHADKYTATRRAIVEAAAALATAPAA